MQIILHFLSFKFWENFNTANFHQSVIPSFFRTLCSKTQR